VDDPWITHAVVPSSFGIDIQWPHRKQGRPALLVDMTGGGHGCHARHLAIEPQEEAGPEANEPPWLAFGMMMAVGRCSVAGCLHLGMTGHGDDDHRGHGA